MSKIKLKDFWKDGYKAVVCKTVDEVKKFQIESFKAGFILGDIKNISEITEDLINEIMKANEGTWCWSNEGFFAGLDFYKGRGFKIYKFKDIEIPTLSIVGSELIKFLPDMDLDLSPSEISELTDKLNDIHKEIHPSYLERLKELQESGDPEYAHGEADDVLCDILKELGFEEIVEAYDKVPKWYA